MGKFRFWKALRARVRFYARIEEGMNTLSHNVERPTFIYPIRMRQPIMIPVPLLLLGNPDDFQ
ncbi:hypothetical protein C2U68_11955 [Methylomonas koyamae]|nr:hypothetical protein C2U68_11955 [Methylomonas koyamae]